MKLTPEQLQFIDSYLTNSGVFYADIHAEMMDHVASAVETKMQAENLDFYDAFKDFMVENKKELIKNNRDGFGYCDTKTFKEGIIILLNPWSLVSLPVTLFLFYLLVGNIDSETFHGFYLGFIVIVVLIWAIGLYLYRKMYLKGKRFFSIEQSGIFFFFIFQIFNPIMIHLKELSLSNFWLHGLFLYFVWNAMAFQIHNFRKHHKENAIIAS
jgi:hypothetical protein